MTTRLEKLLAEGDLRTTGNVTKVLPFVKTQRAFDSLFTLLFHPDRKIAMRAADAAEKLTAKNPAFLKPHREKILQLLKCAAHIELKWHVAQLIPRLELNKRKLKIVVPLLTRQAMDGNESKIVRVNSLQALADLSAKDPGLLRSLVPLLAKLAKEDIPSLRVRAKKLHQVLKN